MLTRQQTAERSSRMRMFSRKYSSGDTLTMQCRQIRVLIQCTTRGWSACVIIRTFSKLSCVRRFEALVRVSRPRVVTCPVIIVLTFWGHPDIECPRPRILDQNRSAPQSTQRVHVHLPFFFFPCLHISHCMTSFTS